MTPRTKLQPRVRVQARAEGVAVHVQRKAACAEAGAAHAEGTGQRALRGTRDRAGHAEGGRGIGQSLGVEG